MSESAIVDIIASLMVLPNRMCIPLIDQVKVDQMKFPLPRVRLAMIGSHYQIQSKCFLCLFSNWRISYTMWTSLGCCTGPCFGGSGSCSKGHVHDGTSKGQVRSIYCAEGREQAIQNKDHQRNFESTLEWSLWGNYEQSSICLDNINNFRWEIGNAKRSH